ncbi:unnamed protein product [Symbiodinium sp. CCMP2592]|nr:unnamed protein product [Symbiodinium sp. CCMP2592]
MGSELVLNTSCCVRSKSSLLVGFSAPCRPVSSDNLIIEVREDQQYMAALKKSLFVYEHGGQTVLSNGQQHQYVEATTTPWFREIFFDRKPLTCRHDCSNARTARLARDNCCLNAPCQTYERCLLPYITNGVISKLVSEYVPLPVHSNPRGKPSKVGPTVSEPEHGGLQAGAPAAPPHRGATPKFGALGAGPASNEPADSTGVLAKVNLAVETPLQLEAPTPPAKRLKTEARAACTIQHSKTSVGSTTQRPYVVLYGDNDEMGREEPKLLRVDGAKAHVVAFLPVNGAMDYEINRHRSGDFYVHSSSMAFSEWCDDLATKHLEAKTAWMAPETLPPSEREPDESGVCRSLHMSFSEEVHTGDDSWIPSCTEEWSRSHPRVPDLEESDDLRACLEAAEEIHGVQVLEESGIPVGLVAPAPPPQD